MEKSRLKYNLIIERTEDPLFYRFFSPELKDFEGGGISVDDCLQKTREKMNTHIQNAADLNIPLPPSPSEARITIKEGEAGA